MTFVLGRFVDHQQEIALGRLAAAEVAGFGVEFLERRHFHAHDRECRVRTHGRIHIEPAYLRVQQIFRSRRERIAGRGITLQ